MVSALSARPALQPRGDRGVDVLRARVGTLAPQPLPQHVLPDLVKIEGGAEPISDLGRGHRHILLSPIESRGGRPNRYGPAFSRGLGGPVGAENLIRGL